jgi:hypothetical protein
VQHQSTDDEREGRVRQVREKHSCRRESVDPCKRFSHARVQQSYVRFFVTIVTHINVGIQWSSALANSNSLFGWISSIETSITSPNEGAAESGYWIGHGDRSIRWEIVHRDSLGAMAEIRAGEVNWMVAGRGDRAFGTDQDRAASDHLSWVAMLGRVAELKKSSVKNAFD